MSRTSLTHLARSIAAGATVALSLGGCSIFQPPVRPGWTTFLLEREPATGNAPASASTRIGTGDAVASEPMSIGANVAEGSLLRTLRVATVESAGGYDTPRMAYVRSEGELEYFAHHRWAEPPGAMLMPLLVTALERTGGFAAILTPSSRATGDRLLETQLLVFRSEFANDTHAAFHATLRATVVASGTGSVLGARTFDAVEPMDEASPGAGAKAAQRAVDRIVGEVAGYSMAVVAVPVATDTR